MENYDSKKKKFIYFVNVTRTFTCYPLHKLGDEAKNESQITSQEFQVKKGKFKFEDVKFEILDLEKDEQNRVNFLHLKIYTYFKKEGFEITLINSSTFSFYEPGVCDASIEYKFKF